MSKVAHAKAILNGLTKEYDPLVITVTSKKVVFSIEEMDCYRRYNHNFPNSHTVKNYVTSPNAYFRSADDSQGSIASS